MNASDVIGCRVACPDQEQTMPTQHGSDKHPGEETHATSKTGEVLIEPKDVNRGAGDQASDIAERAVAKGRVAAASVQEVSRMMKGAV